MASRRHRINTGGGAYVGNNVQVSGGHFIGRDLTIIQQETHFAEIEQLLDTKPVQVLRIYIALEKSLDQNVGSYFKSRVKNLEESLCTHMPEIILELGDRLIQAKLVPAIELCGLLSDYWQIEKEPEVANAFSILAAVIKGQIPAETARAFVLL